MQLRVAGLDALAFDLHISEAAFDRRCFSVPSCEAHRRVTEKRNLERNRCNGWVYHEYSVLKSMNHDIPNHYNDIYIYNDIHDIPNNT